MIGTFIVRGKRITEYWGQPGGPTGITETEFDQHGVKAQRETTAGRTVDITIERDREGRVVRETVR